MALVNRGRKVGITPDNDVAISLVKMVENVVFVCDRSAPTSSIR